MENTDTINPITIIKYIFKSDISSLNLIIYTKIYNLITKYNSKTINNDILPIINNLCSTNIKNPKDINHLAIYILYTQILKYTYNLEKHILNHLINNNNNKLLLTNSFIQQSNNTSLCKYIYIYSSFFLNIKSFLDYRNKFLVGTLIYFNFL